MPAESMLRPWRRRRGTASLDLVFLFRRLVFAQVMLGIVCFCLAERNPGILLIAGAVGGLSWYLTEGPRGKPLPRWLINVAAMGAVTWLIYEMYVLKVHVIVAMGHFTMWLQVLLLYAQKSNREYGQLLVLSLLLMIGASVLSVSVVYGALLVGYCGLMLVTLLMFHFKSTSDRVLEYVRQAAPAHEREGLARPRPLTGRGYAWHFRWSALSLGVICAAVAMATFVVVPRREPGEMMKRLAASPAAPTQAGFRPEIDLRRNPGDGSAHEPVLNLTLTDHGVPVERDALGLRLRGAALDDYEAHLRRWVRSAALRGFERRVEVGQVGASLADLSAEASLMGATITQRITAADLLFTVLPVAHVRSQQMEHLRFSPYDQQVSVPGPVSGAIVYSIRWPSQPPADMVDRYLKGAAGEEDDEPHATRRLTPPDGSSRYARGWPVQPRRLAKLARQILAAQGLDRELESDFDARDPQVAAALADYLRSNYRYSLHPISKDAEDPTISFLFDTRTGHCEVFASALAALTRSLGMQSRVVTGYLVSEFNPIGGYYVVRESHAHAWCEINLGPYGGWQTFDATPPDDVRAEHAVGGGLLTRLRQIYEHLEFTWVRSVVAYDERSRESLLQSINSSMSSFTNRQEGWLDHITRFIGDLPSLWQFRRVEIAVLGLTAFLLGLAVASLIRLLVLRRRRMAALQLDAVPRARRRGLSRKLRFYLQMLDMLERRGYARPEWQSPFSFAQELAEAHPLRFDPVVALTEIFYEIRFGHREMDANRRDRVKAHLRQLDHALTAGDAA